jgi:hypothetical protein
MSYDHWRKEKLQGTIDNILLIKEYPIEMVTYIRKEWPELITISGLLTSVGKASREALILKESTKILENLSVNSRCKSINKKLVSTPVDIALQTVKNSGPSERKAVQAQICKYI